MAAATTTTPKSEAASLKTLEIKDIRDAKGAAYSRVDALIESELAKLYELHEINKLPDRPENEDKNFRHAYDLFRSVYYAHRHHVESLKERLTDAKRKMAEAIDNLTALGAASEAVKKEASKPLIMMHEKITAWRALPVGVLAKAGVRAELIKDLSAFDTLGDLRDWAEKTEHREALSAVDTFVGVYTDDVMAKREDD